MEQQFTSQGHAEDVVNRHRYLYYVLGQPMLDDWEYDWLEARVRKQWSVSCVSHEVGSSDPMDHAEYIQVGRRPVAVERAERDNLITARWLANL